MIYREGINEKQFLDNITTISTVIKERQELKEINNGLCFPKVESISSNYDMDKVTMIHMQSSIELDAVLTCCSALKNNLDLALVIAPTEYDKSFHYNGSFLSKSEAFYQTKASYWMHNRFKAIHNTLTLSGIITVLVTEPMLLIAKELLNDIFGKSNYITTHIVVSNKAGTNKNGVLNQHQYVLVYAKSKQSALDEIAYMTPDGAQFCIEKRDENSQFSQQNIDTCRRAYSDTKSDFDLVSNIRPTKRKENDNNYYPIYYIQGNIDSNGYDWNPKLFLVPQGHPDEFSIYPENETGEDRIWNTISSTFLKNYREDSYVVKLENGKAKLYYKVRDNMSENNNVLEPIRTVLDEGMSNLTTSNKIKKVLGKSEAGYGYNPNLAAYLMSAYSREGSKVLAIGDPYMSVLISLLENRINRQLYTTVHSVQTKLHQLISAIVDEYPHQFILCSTSSVNNDSTLDFIEEVKLKQEQLATLMYSGMSRIIDDESYDIYETSNYDFVVVMKIRYDLEKYTEIKKHLQVLKDEKNRNILLYYLDDSQFCQGTDVIENANFKNLLQNYRDVYLKLLDKCL